MSGISVSDLGFSYGSGRALDGVGFEVPEGRFCALLGPNGAGKSTLFGLLTGLFSTAEGRVHIAGHDIARSPLEALAVMGVVFQQPTLDLDLTVLQNLTYFAALHGITGPAARSRALEALDRLGMADRAAEKVRALNGGHRRRTEIARALVHDPLVLLLDEPTVGLDAAARIAITEHVHMLAAEDGMTVLWATHLTDEIRADDLVVVLHGGRVCATGTAEELSGGSTLNKAFLNMTGAPA